MLARDDKNVEQELLEEFGEDFLANVFRYVYQMMDDFLVKHYLTERVCPNKAAIKQCLIDTLSKIIYNKTSPPQIWRRGFISLFTQEEVCRLRLTFLLLSQLLQDFYPRW